MAAKIETPLESSVSDIEDPDIAVELDSKGWYVVKSIDTVVPYLDKGELNVKTTTYCC